MEAFESFIALALEDDGYVVSGAVKFPVRIKTGKKAYDEFQEHGFEVDLVGARSDGLVLATVKSFFGSGGVRSEEVKGTSKNERGNKLYALLNNKTVRRGVIKEAAARYGYRPNQVELRLYVGRFAAPVRAITATRSRSGRGGGGSRSTASIRSSIGCEPFHPRSSTGTTRRSSRSRSWRRLVNSSRRNHLRADTSKQRPT